MIAWAGAHPAWGAARTAQIWGAAPPVGCTWVDTNGDGPVDVWEMTYGLDANNPRDAGLDQDGDALTSQQEFVAGADPTDPQSALRLIVSGDGPRGWSLQFMAAPGKSYSRQVRDSLATGSWRDLRSFAASTTGGFTTATDSLAGQGPCRYYRLVTPASRTISN